MRRTSQNRHHAVNFGCEFGPIDGYSEIKTVYYKSMWYVFVKTMRFRQCSLNFIVEYIWICHVYTPSHSHLFSLCTKSKEDCLLMLLS